jgi:predicted ArsR family transcriptional regulator
MAKYGETTARALEALSRPRSIAQLAEVLGCARSNAAGVIGRLWKTGAIDREQQILGEIVLRQDPGRTVTRPHTVYFYQVTEKGQERLKRIRRRIRG